MIATNDKGHRTSAVVPLAVDSEGRRCPPLEKTADDLFQAELAPRRHSRDEALRLPSESIEPMLLRDLVHRGIVREDRAPLWRWLLVGGALLIPSDTPLWQNNSATRLATPERRRAAPGGAPAPRPLQRRIWWITKRLAGTLNPPIALQRSKDATQ